MLIGVCRVIISIPDSFSLKEKRKVKRSIVDRVRAKFNVSIAEVDSQEIWNELVLGISMVSTESKHIYEVMSEIIKLIEEQKEAELIDYEIDIL
ncbi:MULTISPECIES: DUF503 domain-containing protein [Dictyoglomus]|jgi:uncharacterized protein YlxP (DUF503 family)|uniref:DUF503 domain-containing protein n=1 Tax=Dictyoglomus turgidum (strain DSM 6724 / Z-1310) TaxID=515635 RepID=B8E2Y8_DICTD|nr:MULTISPECIES: DUF503 domain-containing protein [Dictyoglomus]ACK42488.1 protein of unknown function DUF503 [Dictyoglomus turgidum DSM 6724]PNV79195.1 MAG: DUF503 domain-containing protein [Dictyoglomus turgidum]HBU32055.1 DUF503 domain-containing protein [Dictyoglomus sp.]